MAAVFKGGAIVRLEEVSTDSSAELCKAHGAGSPLVNKKAGWSPRAATPCKPETYNPDAPATGVNFRLPSGIVLGIGFAIAKVDPVF